MKRLITHSTLVGTLLVVLSGCIVDLDEETFAPGAWREACVYPHAPGVTAQTGAFSLTFSGETYWIFGEATLAQPNARGERVLSNMGAVARQVPTTCSDELDYVTDDAGQPVQVIPFADEEQAFNAAHPDGPRIALWPLSGFVHGGAGWIYYRKVLVRDLFDVAELGVGLARVDSGGLATRLRPAVHSGEPTLLWLNPQADWGTGAFLDPDGFVYLYGCSQRAAFDWGCRVARVAPDQATAPSAYAYYDALNDRWIDSPQNASVIFTGPMTISAGYNASLNRYAVVYAPFLSNDVEMRTAPHPWGPFEPGRTLLTGDPPAFLFIRDVQMHAAHHRDEGKTLFLSYYSAPESKMNGMRLGLYELN